MEIKIDKKFDNKLLNRLEVDATISYPGATPKREEIRKGVAEKLGKKAELTVLREYYTEFGKKEAKAVLHIYEDEETMKKTEPKYILKRDGLVKEEKKEENKEG